MQVVLFVCRKVEDEQDKDEGGDAGTDDLTVSHNVGGQSIPRFKQLLFC